MLANSQGRHQMAFQSGCIADVIKPPVLPATRLKRDTAQTARYESDEIVNKQVFEDNIEKGLIVVATNVGIFLK